MSDDLDPKYLSAEMREKIESVKKELTENPITRTEEIYTWFRVNVVLVAQVKYLRFCVWFKRFFNL